MTYLGLKVCPDCEGLGRVEYELPVIDYVNGGYLDSRWGDCERCSGTGEIEDWEEDEEE
jgi:hypothetical protein